MGGGVSVRDWEGVEGKRMPVDLLENLFTSSLEI